MKKSPTDGKMILSLLNRALIDMPMEEHYLNLCLMLWYLLRLIMDAARLKTQRCLGLCDAEDI